MQEIAIPNKISGLESMENPFVKSNLAKYKAELEAYENENAELKEAVSDLIETLEELRRELNLLLKKASNQ